MKANITYCVNRNQTKPRADKASTEFMSASVIGDVRNFHRTVPGYAVTPLHSLSSLAQAMRVRQILIKDESQRFGLNAFKALGGSFAIARYICNKLGMGCRTNISRAVSAFRVGQDKLRAQLKRKLHVCAD